MMHQSKLCQTTVGHELESWDALTNIYFLHTCTTVICSAENTIDRVDTKLDTGNREESGLGRGKPKLRVLLIDMI